MSLRERVQGPGHTLLVDLGLGTQCSGHGRVQSGAESHGGHARARSTVAVGSLLSRGPGQEEAAPCPRGGPHLLVILLQTLVVFAQRGQVDEGNHVLEAVDPLLAF